MMRKLLLIGGLAGTGLIVASQWPDMVRYLRIERMSVIRGPVSRPSGGSHQTTLICP
jgi:hypothetical protein